VAKLGPAWDEEDRWVIGAEGIVDEYVGPAEDGNGWELLVWIAEPGEPDPVLWVFREDELVSTGLLAASEDGGERIPLDPAVSPPELEDKLGLWLGTDLTRLPRPLTPVVKSRIPWRRCGASRRRSSSWSGDMRSR
jgi:hypothetical protein